MAKAGFCAQCGTQVWLNDDGSCVNCHPAVSVSGVFEAVPAAPVPVSPVPMAPQASAGKPASWMWIAGGIALIVLIVVFATRPTPTAVDNSAMLKAQENSCEANQRIVMGGIQTYQAMYPERGSVTTDWSGAMAVLIPDVIKVEPKCPAGGTYRFVSAGQVECSVHGEID